MEELESNYGWAWDPPRPPYKKEQRWGNLSRNKQQTMRHKIYSKERIWYGMRWCEEEEVQRERWNAPMRGSGVRTTKLNRCGNEENNMHTGVYTHKKSCKGNNKSRKQGETHKASCKKERDGMVQEWYRGIIYPMTWKQQGMEWRKHQKGSLLTMETRYEQKKGGDTKWIKKSQ